MTSFRKWPSDGGPHTSVSIGSALAGLIRRDGNGLPVPGVLGPLSVTAVPTSWKVEVPPFTFVVRAGGGIQLSGLSAAEQVDITPATGIPAGQGRIDVVAWDASSDAVVVVPGTVSASPVVPNAAGYEPLVRVRVNSGDGAVVQSRVTPVFERTALAGDADLKGTVAKRSVPAGGVTIVNVAFPVGLFTGVPNVQVSTLADTRVAGAIVDNVTVSGCTIRLTNSGASAASVGAMWRASL